MGDSQKVKKVKKEKIFTTSFIWIFLSMFLVRLTFAIQSTGIPLYVQSLGNTKSIAGLMTTCFTISALVFRPVVGKLLDKFQRKTMLFAGTIIFMIVSYSYGFTASLPILFILRSIHGVGFALQGTANSTVATDVIPEDRMSEGIGYFGLSNSLGQALGPMIAIELLNGFGYTKSFLVGGVLTTLAFISIFPVKVDRYRQKLKEADGTKAPEIPIVPKWWHNILEPTGVRTAVVISLVALAAASVNTFLPTRALELKISNIGSYFTIQAVAVMVARISVGKVSSRFGSSYIIIPAGIMMIICFALMGLARSLGQFLAIAAFYGLAFGMLQPELQAIMVVDAPVKRRGMANSTFFLAYDLGVGVGAAFHGWVADMFAHTAIKTGAIYFGSSVLSAVMLLAYIFLMAPARKKKKLAAKG